MKRVLLFIVSAGMIQLAVAQTPSIKTSVDRTKILIGQQIKYTVAASFPGNQYSITWLSVPDSFAHFEVVTRGRIDTLGSNGMVTLKQMLTLTSFDSGVYAIPQLPVKLEPLANDSVFHLFTDSIPIAISFSPLDSTETFHDIKTIIEVKDEIPWWMWAGAAALLLLLATLVIYLVKYFRKRKKIVPLFNSKLSPFDEAMQSLGALQNEHLLAKNDQKQYHSRLAAIFKLYLSRKMQQNVLNLTSSETLLLLDGTLLSKVDTALLAGVLRMSDAVKFAKYVPPVAESESSWITTRKVIEQLEKLVFTDQNPTAV